MDFYPSLRRARPPAGAIGLAAVFAFGLTAATGAAWAEPTAIAVVSVDGQAPGDLLPFSTSQSSGGRGTPATFLETTTVHGPHEIPTGPSNPQVFINADVNAAPGQTAILGNVRFSDRGPGTAGAVDLAALALTSDTITIQGDASQAGKHLLLNGAFIISLKDFTTDGQGQASAQFPRPATSIGFADADSHLTLSLSGEGVSGGVAVLAESRSGIDNETGSLFDVNRSLAQVPFQLDVVVGQPTEISFVTELDGHFSIGDLTTVPFSDSDGDAGLDLASFDTTVTWVQAAASVTDPITGRVVRGLGLTSDSGFDWLGGDTGPAGVPEPNAWALLITGFGLTGARIRRRRGVRAPDARIAAAMRI